MKPTRRGTRWLSRPLNALPLWLAASAFCSMFVRGEAAAQEMGELSASNSAVVVSRVPKLPYAAGDARRVARSIEHLGSWPTIGISAGMVFGLPPRPARVGGRVLISAAFTASRALPTRSERSARQLAASARRASSSGVPRRERRVAKFAGHAAVSAWLENARRKPVPLDHFDDGIPDGLPQALAKGKRDVQHCHRRSSVLEGNQSGRFVMEIIVNVDGTVARTAIEENELDDDFAVCLEPRVAKWQFPPQPVALRFSQRWVF